MPMRDDGWGENIAGDIGGIAGNLTAVITGEMVREKLMAVGGGALGSLITGNAIKRIGYFTDPANEWLKYVAEALSGLLIGRVIYGIDEDLAMGWVGAVTGQAVAQMIVKLLPPEWGLSAGLGEAMVNVTVREPYNYTPVLAGLNAPSLGESAITPESSQGFEIPTANTHPWWFQD